MSDAAANDADRWEVPSIDGDNGQVLMTASRLQELQKEAYDEAFEEGKKAGLKAGQEEIAERLKRLDALLEAQTKPLADLDEEVEQHLVELAMQTARQLFRREIKLEPEHIVGVVHEAVALLPIASRNIEVHLHPDDAGLLRELMHDSDGDSAWTVLEDPLIERGGCRVTTDTSQVDAQNSARLHAVLSKILGEERHQ